MHDSKMTTIPIKGLGDLPEAAAAVVETIAEHPIVAFYGPMGAGKTTLIKEICRQLEVEEIVTSPTFSIINVYLTSSGDPIYHFDFYRLDNPDQAFDLGYEEYLFSGHPCLIEWPEKIEGLLPHDAVSVVITPSGQSRNERILEIKI